MTYTYTVTWPSGATRICRQCAKPFNPKTVLDVYCPACDGGSGDREPRTPLNPLSSRSVCAEL